MEKFVMIMAGGSGTRLWPLAKANQPKQAQKIDGEKTVLEKVIDHALELVNKNNLFITVGENQEEYVREIFPNKDNIIRQPMDRNNAVALLQGITKIQERNLDGVVAFLPSDHLIKKESYYKESIFKAMETAGKTKSIVAIGTKVLWANSGLGYINAVGNDKGEMDILEFVEKPNKEKAVEFWESDRYLWNSGIYVSLISSLLEDYAKYLPKMYGLMIEKNRGKEVLVEEEWEKIYNQVEAISIDYGIIEKKKNLKCIESEHEWMDIGTYDYMENFHEKDNKGNVKIGDVITYESKNNTIYGENKAIVTFGLEDSVVIDAENVILICHKDKTQEVRRIVENLANVKRNDLL